MKVKILVYLILVVIPVSLLGQKPITNSDVYVDSNGVMRWENTNHEVSLFGVNYTTPFAYAYRAHKRLGISLKKAIDIDVAQMVRLGMDAFRVHVWDREISDKQGNLIKNEHLDLFDYLLARLSANGIKIILTPIAWWGNGYPEPDEETTGFSQFYSKLELITNSEARAAQRNYLEQFIRHVNPYTKKNYKDDPLIIAMEIINEPAHPENGKETAQYINEMVKVFRTAGYKKPIFYNISQNWMNVDYDEQAHAVANSNVEGVSFQWYPTDLVHNKMLEGNYLRNVNTYPVPGKNVNGYNKKTKMVYEFDAADIGESYMYPAMVRSFRGAGIRFAAVFSYDPTQIAWSNTEYPTHYLNLLYTPAKAISLMIAAEAFRKIPLYKTYGNYPANNGFDDFRVSSEENLSELNSDSLLYYSNSTQSLPRNSASLVRVAGIGSSPIVKYDGTGVYFLDKLGNGIWQLEVYPDVIWIKDPFERTSLSRQVARLFWNERKMRINFNDLGSDFYISQINGKKTKAIGQEFTIKPGSYLIYAAGVKNISVKKYLATKGKFLDGLYLPENLNNVVEVVNNSHPYHVKTNEIDFKFQIASKEKIIRANIFMRRPGWRGFEKHLLKPTDGFNYILADTTKIMNPGQVEYCVAVETEDNVYTFPGGLKGSPEDWDFDPSNTWFKRILNPGEAVVFFDPARHRKKFIFPQFTKSMRYFVDYKNGSNNNSNSVSVNISFSKESKDVFGLQLNVEKFLKPFVKYLNGYKSVLLRARSSVTGNSTINLNFLTRDANSFGCEVTLSSERNDIEIPISEIVNKPSLILPFSYPHFLPKVWESVKSTDDKIDITKLEFIQIFVEKSGAQLSNDKYDAGYEIESITLK